MIETYRTLEAFYRAHPEAARSPEWDYGVCWTEQGRQWPCWRVSWVVETGHVYAYRMGGGGFELVRVLGVVPAEGHYPYPPMHSPDSWTAFKRNQENPGRIEAVLRGWEHIAHKPGSLEWVERRMAETKEEATAA